MVGRKTHNLKYMKFTLSIFLLQSLKVSSILMLANANVLISNKICDSWDKLLRIVLVFIYNSKYSKYLVFGIRTGILNYVFVFVYNSFTNTNKNTMNILNSYCYIFIFVWIFVVHIRICYNSTYYRILLCNIRALSIRIKMPFARAYHEILI